MKPSQLVTMVLPSMGPFGAIIGSKLGGIDEDPTMKTIADVLTTLASRDEMEVGDFVKSGRAIEVLRALTLGVNPPEKRLTSQLNMFRCEKCLHVHYQITE